MKITITNVKNVTEDALCIRLDDLYDAGEFDSAEYKMIDGELDRRAAAHLEAERNRALKRALALEKIQEKLEEFNKLRSSNSKIVMKSMVEEFGNEFEEDYVIEEFMDKFIVKSLCIFNLKTVEQDTWICETKEEASKKVFHLIYWRVYDRYFRQPDTGSIERLKSAMECIKKEA